MGEEFKNEYKKMRKDALFIKLAKAFDEYVDGIVLVVNVNSAGSFQLQKLRGAMREHGVLIMGKNTLIRKVLRERAMRSNAYQDLIPYLTGTIGLLFTRQDVGSVQKLIKKHTWTALPVREGTIATENIMVYSGATGMDPSRTSFLAALNIPSKICKGEIEFTRDVVICQKGEKIPQSVATLCESLKIKPFSREANIIAVYERGYAYDYRQYVLANSLRDCNLVEMFLKSVFRFAAVSAALGIVNEATMPYYFAGALRTIHAVSSADRYDMGSSETDALSTQFQKTLTVSMPRYAQSLAFAPAQLTIHH